MLDQVHVLDVLHCESLVGFHFDASDVRDGLPMTVLHSFGQHGTEHVHLWGERFNLLLNDLGNLDDLVHVFVAEEFEVLVDEALGIADGLLKHGRVDRQEVVIQPGRHVRLPVVDRGPQIVEGAELAEHLLDVLIRGLLDVGQTLILVVLFSLVGRRGHLLVQSSGLSGNFFIAVEFDVLVEGSDLVVEFRNLRLELGLVRLHEANELVLLSVEDLSLLLNLLEGVSWGAEEAPLSIKVVLLAELELEFFQDPVDLHSGGDVVLKLGDLTGSLTHRVLDLREVLDVLRGALDCHVEAFKGIHGIVSHLSGLLGDQLDDFSRDFLMLVSDDVANATAVDSEHAHHGGVLNLRSELFSLLSVLNDELSEICWLRLSLLIGKLGDLLIRVQLVLVLVDLEGVDVLLEWLDALVHFRLQALVLLVNPSVLIGKSLLFRAIGYIRHLVRLHGHLERCLLVRLEEMWHELLFELGDLLEGEQTILECPQDRKDDIIGLVAVDNLILFVQDQVDLEKREFLRLRSNLLDLLFRVVDVLDLAGTVDGSVPGKEPVDGVHVVLDGAAGELEDSVLHEVALLDEELAKLTDLVSLLVRLRKIEPGVLTFSGLLMVRLDDLFDLGHPRLLQVVGSL